MTPVAGPAQRFPSCSAAETALKLRPKQLSNVLNGKAMTVANAEGMRRYTGEWNADLANIAEDEEWKEGPKSFKSRLVCDVDKPRRPDAPWLGTDRAVLCETDEHSHTASGYEPECCAAWATDMTEALVSLYRDKGHDGDALRVFIVRWNPDARDSDRPVIRKEERARIVGERIQALREMPAEELAQFPPMVPIVLYYYYHSKAQRWIDFASTSNGILVLEVVE
jgi:hypothetical protein